MFFTLVLVEVKNMKVKGQILIFTAIMLNDHSNPYIESTTVLSDNYRLFVSDNLPIIQKKYSPIILA